MKIIPESDKTKADAGFMQSKKIALDDKVIEEREREKERGSGQMRSKHHKIVSQVSQMIANANKSGQRQPSRKKEMDEEGKESK